MLWPHGFTVLVVVAVSSDPTAGGVATAVRVRRLTGQEWQRVFCALPVRNDAAGLGWCRDPLIDRERADAVHV